MTFWRRETAFDLIIEQPRAGVAPRRLQRFAGFVQSNEPLPPFRVVLGGIEQAISRHDLGDPAAPVDRRHTAYFHFHTEVAPSRWHGRLDLEVFAGRNRIARRSIRRGRPDDRSSPLVCVLHIPKTAGTSLRLALEAQSPLRLLSLYDSPYYISSRAAVSPSAFDDLDIVMGHFVYGIHQVTHRPCRYVTLLRHPADLLKSTYLFHKHVLHSPGYAHCGTIFDAIRADPGQFDNVQTRFVSGKSAADPVVADDLAVAVANMQRAFAYVGTVEDMATSVRAIGAYLGIPLPCHTANETPAIAEGTSITRAEIVAYLGAYLEHDMRLYERARELFSAGARA